jgi:hypothetical protein
MLELKNPNSAAKLQLFFDMSKFILVFVVVFWRISFRPQHGARLPRAF